MSSAFKERLEYRKGDVTQRLLASYFKRYEWFVIPSYDYTADESKAPRMEGARESYVLPDLDICKAGDRRWAEAKYKDHATWYRVGRRLEHGIALRHFNHYKQVARQSGADVWLFVHEGCTGKVLARRVVELEPHGRVYGGGGMDRGGMIFFPRREFQRLANIPHPIGEREAMPLRKLITGLLDRGVHIGFDRKQRQFDIGPPGLIHPWEMATIRSKIESAYTIIVGLDLFPWFGEI